MSGEQATLATEPITVGRGYPAPRPPHRAQIMIEVPGHPVDPPPTYGLVGGGGDQWRWRDREIARLESLLAEGGPANPGLGGGSTASGVDGSGAGPLLALLRTGDGVDREVLAELLTTMVSTAGLTEAVRELEVAGQLSSLIEHAHRRRGLARLVAVIDDPVSPVEALRAAVEQEEWVFGGRFIPPFAIGEVPELRRISLPLVRTDGAIHVVEVGPAYVPDLIMPVSEESGDRLATGYGVGPDVQAAVNRVINQLRLVDELAGPIRRALQVETRRAMATVLIGHGQHLADPRDEPALATTLRTYSSHLAGIEVVSYDELVRNAERSLAMDEPPATLTA